MDTPDGSPVLRIGELSRRAGVTDHVLRAWESRYGLLQPVRSAGGFRLYSEADALRVRRMQAHLARGLSAAEAARAVLGEDGPAGADRVEVVDRREKYKACARSWKRRPDVGEDAEYPDLSRRDAAVVRAAGIEERR